MVVAHAQKLDARSIQDLMSRIDAQFPPGRGRLTGFIASTRGEGTSTVAWAYAHAMATQSRRRILLLDAGSETPGEPVGGRGSLVGMLALMDAQRNPDTRPVASIVMPGVPPPAAPGILSVWELLPRAELWISLRERFDEVVIDLPAPSQSRVGLAVAPYCDGVAVVVEAERARAPVVENLVGHLRQVRVRVLGAVLNKRRFHLPARVYRLL
jgi:hypothetical protein